MSGFVTGVLVGIAVSGTETSCADHRAANQEQQALRLDRTEQEMKGASIGRKRQKRLDLIGWSIIAMLVISTFIVTLLITRHKFIHTDRVDRNKIQMHATVQALDVYKLQNGTYPARLQALVDQGVMPRLPTDKWDRYFYYWRTADGRYWLASLGKDNQPGGDGVDEDFMVPDPPCSFGELIRAMGPGS